MNTRFLYPFGVSVQIKNFWSRFFACSFCVSVNDCISVLLQAPNPSAAPSVGQADPSLPLQRLPKRNMVLLHAFTLIQNFTFPYLCRVSGILYPGQACLHKQIQCLLRHCRIAQNKFMGRILIYVKSLFSNPF